MAAINSRERIKKLRDRMKELGLAACYIPTNDPHGSEYIGEYFKCREYLSGFTGSAGEMVVTDTEAGLWTDGRYFLQAEQQLEGTGIVLYRLQEEGVPSLEEFLEQKLEPGQKLGFDGRLLSVASAKRLKQRLEKKGIRIDPAVDPVGDIWEDRPPLSCQPAYSLDLQYAGVSCKEKMKWVCEWLRRAGADYLVLTSLDDIAWLLNIRGDDIHCNPVVLAYLLVGQEERRLFVQEGSCDGPLRAMLARDKVELRPYEAIYDELGRLPGDCKVAMDHQIVNWALLRSVAPGITVKNETNPTIIMKAIKNPVEVENERKAHIKDGVAVTRLIYWIKQNIGRLPLTELGVAQKLEELRGQQEHYVGPSFDPIAGYAEHGAIVHYSATPETDRTFRPEGFLLLDTGGHYLEGTTDITRTVLLGGCADEEQKQYYTAVLRGNLNLMAAKFRYGCSGVALDYLARAPLWELGCDYNHGTGHGVGYLLNVHEGPNAFRYRVASRPGGNAVLEEGMITSDEPGIYLEGKYGIRLENLLLCVKREKTPYGQFMGFEPLTMAPFERKAIDVMQMSDRERQLLDQYHRKVFENLSPYLDRDERDWLEEECAPL